MRVTIEATDEADALALKERIELFLKTLDKGDYCGRVVGIEGQRYRVFDRDDDWNKDYFYESKELVEYARELQENNSGETDIETVEQAIDFLETKMNIGVEAL